MPCSKNVEEFKNLLMPLFLMGCFPVDFQEAKRPLRTKSGKRPIKVGKRPIKEGKRPIKAMVLVGISIGCLMGCFRAPPPWRKTASLKRPIKRSMTLVRENQTCTKSWLPFCVAFAPLFPKGNWPFSSTGKPPSPPPLSVGSLIISTGSPV